MVYLVDNEPARSQYRSPRRAAPSGVMVVHTAENTPDVVATDGGAEAVANFIRTRSDPGSYHDLVDSDSAIQLVRWSDEAFQDGTGSNPHAWGGSVATTAAWWPIAPPAWRDGAIRQLARRAAAYAHWLRDNYGITVPARRITRNESDNRVPGFISHAERDPTRRSDPGAAFPWDQFLAEYVAAFSGQPVEDDMPTLDEIAQVVRAELDRGQAFGVTPGGYAGTLPAILTQAQKNFNQINVNTAKVLTAVDTVDEEILAGLIAPLTAALVENLPDATEEALANAAERAIREVFADAGTPDG